MVKIVIGWTPNTMKLYTYTVNSIFLSGLHWYASVSTPNSYIIIGGTDTGTEISDAITELKDDMWGRGFLCSST